METERAPGTTGPLDSLRLAGAAYSLKGQ